MMIRKATPADSVILAQLAGKLWAHAPEELEPEFVLLTHSNKSVCFIAQHDDTPVGFAQCQLRFDYVEGCETSPVGFLEGIYVDADYRRSGCARQLLSACEEWARSKGCSEFASDCELDNQDSLRWHLKAGFAEMGRTIWFAKKL